VSQGPARALASAPAAIPTRSLSTARSVLRVLSLLVQRPTGIRADEGASALGKSTSTAYYLLTSLCEEGFAVHESKGVYRPARGLEELTAVAEEAAWPPEGLEGAVDRLFTLTRKRSYLGVARGGRIEITTFRGRQGVPRIPGLGTEIRESAHALAMGKVVLALLDSDALARYVARGLRSFTPQTITSADELDAELAQVREEGFAVDREEFDENFCCIAAPIRDTAGRFVAVLGLSVSATVFDAECEHLAQAVTEIAAEASPPAVAGHGFAAPAAAARFETPQLASVR
jgi:IclR family acetate operon transcriptional repressor